MNEWVIEWRIARSQPFPVLNTFAWIIGFFLMNDYWLFSFPLLSGSISTRLLSPQVSQRFCFFFLIHGPQFVVSHLDQMCVLPSDILVEGVHHSVNCAALFHQHQRLIVKSCASNASKESGPIWVVWLLLSPPEWVTEMFMLGFHSFLARFKIQWDFERFLYFHRFFSIVECRYLTFSLTRADTSHAWMWQIKPPRFT